MINYKKMMGRIFLGAVTSLAISQAFAQEIPSDSGVYRGAWGISGEVINFNADMAALNGISDTGYGLGASYRGEKGLFNFALGLSFFFIDDKDEFSQRVENDWTGDESTEDSSIDAGSLYVDGGVQYPINDSGSFVVGLNAGYRYFDIDRGITNCRDCFSEDITIESDTYLKPFTRFAFSDRVFGSLAYFSYTGDKGAENSMQFEVQASF